MKHFKSRRYTTLDFKRQKNNKKDKRIKSRKGIRNRRMKISSIDDKKVFGFQLSLVVKRNNVFGHFLDLKKQKTLATCSSGKSKIKVSKKTVRFFYSSILAKFIKKVMKDIQSIDPNADLENMSEEEFMEILEELYESPKMIKKYERIINPYKKKFNRKNREY